jgi:hypothetical protein
MNWLNFRGGGVSATGLDHSSAGADRGAGFTLRVARSVFANGAGRFTCFGGDFFFRTGMATAGKWKLHSTRASK